MKQISKSNPRVEVYPKTTAFGFTVSDANETCYQIEADIKRHVNDVLSVTIVHDINATCSHCGAQWTDDSSEFNGGCCDKDLADDDARKGGAK